MPDPGIGHAAAVHARRPMATACFRGREWPRWAWHTQVLARGWNTSTARCSAEQSRITLLGHLEHLEHRKNQIALLLRQAAWALKGSTCAPLRRVSR
jgi:hypothetical protein